MDWRLLLDYIKALIWPAVTLSMGLIFRHQLAGIFKRVESVETPLGTVNLQTQAEAIAREASEIENEIAAEISGSEQEQYAEEMLPPSISEDSTRQLESLLAVAELNPPAAVMAAWREIERAIEGSLPASEGRPQSVSARLKVASNRGSIPGDLATLALDLQRLRDRVAHGEHPSPSQAGARSYILAAERVLEALQLAATPMARHVRFEQEVYSALIRLGFSVKKLERDGRHDFLVGDPGNAIGVEVKYRPRGFSAQDLRRQVELNPPDAVIPTIVVTNTPLLSESVRRFNAKTEEGEGTSLREVVQWGSPQDDNALMRALIRSGSVL